VVLLAALRLVGIAVVVGWVVLASLGAVKASQARPTGIR
jgi:hypothetical protein